MGNFYFSNDVNLSYIRDPKVEQRPKQYNMGIFLLHGMAIMLATWKKEEGCQQLVNPKIKPSIVLFYENFYLEKLFKAHVMPQDLFSITVREKRVSYTKMYGRKDPGTN